MFKVVLLLLLLNFSGPQQAFGQELIQGTGIYRPSQESCLKSLPEFNEKLTKLGLKLVEETECKRVPGEPHSFAPVFTATAENNYQPETAIAAHVSNPELCRKVLSDISSVLMDSNEVVIESGCVRLTQEDSSDNSNSRYQPMIFLIKRSS